MKPSAYVGVSGFVSAAEVRAALDAFPDCGRQLMVGVLASAKTLAGLSNKYPRRYSRCEDIAGIFIADPRCLNLVHYATEVSMRLGFELIEAMRAGGPSCHGLQINVPLPAKLEEQALLHAAMEMFRQSHPGARIVLQLRSGGAAVGELGLIACSADPWITAVLLDASGGTGARIDPARAASLVEETALHRRTLACRFAIGIAGGLCAETLPDVADLVRSGVSIDAEGRLRDAADGGGNLDLERVRAYLRAAAEACGG